MADQPPPRPGAAPPTRAPNKYSALTAACGLGFAVVCAPFVSGWESGGKQRLVAYPDAVGVWTICDGETLDVKKGDRETAEGCALRLDKRLAGFAQAVAVCTPSLRGHDNQWAAATSLAYNIGSAAYCRSTVDRRFDAQQWRAACDAMLMWDKAGGRRVQGLANRRTAERALCLKGLV